MIEEALAAFVGAAGVAVPALYYIRSRTRAHAGPTAESMRGGTHLGNIPLIGSRGLDRSATYRGVYLTNPWVFAAVNKLARDYARMPIHVFELGESGRRRRIRGDIPTTLGRPLAGELLDRLIRQPDPSMSRFALFHSSMIDRLVYGNGLWSLEERIQGIPVGVRRRRWRDVARIEESKGRPVYYELHEGDRFGRSERLVPDDVVHFGRGTDPEGVVGISPLESCRYTIALYEGVVRHLVAYFENQARPSGHVSVDNLTEEKAALIRHLITDAYASPENAGKVLVTSGKWESVTETPEHSQVVELIRLSREETAAVYGVPPPVLGILDRATYANVKALREQYIREGLAPWVTEADQDLMAQLVAPVPAWRYHFLEAQLAEQLRPDLEARAMVYERMRKFFSIDQIRQMENEEPFDLPGLSDVPWVDSGSRPITAFTPARPKMPKEPAVEPEAESNGHKTLERLEVG